MPSQPVLPLEAPNVRPTPDPRTGAPGDPPDSNMVWIPGGTFQMGSASHYAEERPVHRVTVDGFWIDRTPVTNEQFARFVDDTGHTTFAEIAPDPADYPGAPAGTAASRLARVREAAAPRESATTSGIGGASCSAPIGGTPTAPSSTLPGLARPSGRARRVTATPKRSRDGRERNCRPRRSGNSQRAGVSTGATYAWGDEFMPNGRPMANTWQGRFPHENTLADGWEGRRRSARSRRMATACTT